MGAIVARAKPPAAARRGFARFRFPALPCVRGNSFSGNRVVQRTRIQPAKRAGFVSPARKRWVKWNKSAESRRDGTVLTHTLSCWASMFRPSGYRVASAPRQDSPCCLARATALRMCTVFHGATRQLITECRVMNADFSYLRYLEIHSPLPLLWTTKAAQTILRGLRVSTRRG